MARRIWLLVEFVEERNIFPTYGIINVDSITYSESDLNPGKQIFIRGKHEIPRRAQILRISDSKRYLLEHKELLERQDQKVKNVMELCMRTIKEMKTESMYVDSSENNRQRVVTAQNSIPHIIPMSDNSASDSDPETNSQDRSRVIHLNKPVKYNHFKGVEGSRHSRSTFSPATNQRCRSIISSTPLLGNSIQEDIKLTFDQGTQTDNSLLQPPLEKIEEMESMLKSLYQRFQSLVTQVNSNAVSIPISGLEHNDVNLCYNEPLVNGSWAEHNSQYIETDSVTEQNQINGESGRGHEEAAPNSINGSNVNSEVDKKNMNILRVRRMSAQTTNNIEQNPSNDSNNMVAIGNGNAVVPARLLNEIDWNSHTSATRQLLQAIFPRKVLATHSLTGKQSPAFTNKPPKKILDPMLVDDIVKTVSTRCGVPKNLVRNSITIKCTDEAKLYRNRQYKHARQISNQNEENNPPSTPSSDESSAVTN